MAPERWGVAYWASGGEVVGRRGALTMARALELLEFFHGEAKAARDEDNQAAFGFCLRMAVDLARAIIGAKTWRRAA
jgi:hypothetical protein